ncbi:MAG: alkaline phosphatase family protein, partial [Chloroflexota bacterium]|nr:alkaline phosphatase family protein [Chloroflexota bacterium]
MAVRFPDGELSRWACLGGMTQQSIQVWLRDPTAEPQPAVAEIDGAVVARAVLRPSPEHDWIDAVDLVLDRPRPNAEVVVRVAGMERRGRLAPAPGAPAALSFGFASCHQPFENGRDGTLSVHRIAAIYPAIARLLRDRRARFMLLLGDQIYSDGVDAVRLRDESRRRDPPPSERELRDAYRLLYRGYFNEPGFRSLLESVPSLMIWDDHDISDNWGSFLDWEDGDDRLFRAAATAYREYQYARNVGARLDDEAPYHRCYWFGDVGFFILDLRSERDYRQGRVLGERQWRDLDRFLAEAAEHDARTLFIAASIPVVHHGPSFVRLTEWLPTLLGADIRDRWSAAPIEPEREALLERLFDWQVAGPRRQVIVLSGDVHAGAAFRIRRRRGPGTVLQWTSSPLTTRPTIVEVLANRVGTRWVNFGDDVYRAERRALLPTNNVGLVQVEPVPGGGHRVSLSLHAFAVGRGLREAV